MSKLVEFISSLNDNIIWGTPMVILMISVGTFLTLITKGVLFRRFNIVLRYTLFTLFRKSGCSNSDSSITPFQAVCTALAATVGTGNIVGVALAIATGGPGAIFWLWTSALLGMVIKYCEVLLSVAFRTINKKGEIVGGPMYYISKGFGAKRLAFLFSIFGATAAFGIGASVQANSLAVNINHSFRIPTNFIGILLATLSALVLVGGIRRIASVTEFLVPFMAVFYIVSAIVVLLINSPVLPVAFAAIFKSALTGTAATGGFCGATVMYACKIGMARGVFTHEAGMGSAPIAHASATTDHPARQGLWGAFEVFIDSMVMCTITGLVILTSGLWYSIPMMNGGAMSSAAFDAAFRGGKYVITIGLTLFAFATIIAWYYYGEKCVEYLFRQKFFAVRIYQLVYIVFVYIGCVTNLDTIWEFADLFNGLMAIPNLIALIVLSPIIKRLTEDFFTNYPSPSSK